MIARRSPDSTGKERDAEQENGRAMQIKSRGRVAVKNS